MPLALSGDDALDENRTVFVGAHGRELALTSP
jgi:hypothetical protein